MAGSTTLLDNPGPSASIGAQKPVTFNSEGWNLGGSSVSGGGGGGGGGAGGKRTLPHIDDIVSVTVQIDPNISITNVLQQAETCFRGACTSKSFGRLDLALKEYIKAHIILVDIQRNKGWPSLQVNKAQHDRYQNIVRQVKEAGRDFDRIKEEIKADNARTGVRPLSQTAVSGSQIGKSGGDFQTSMAGTLNGGAVSTTAQNGSPQRPAPPTPKTKPIVHPKPSNLHGKSLSISGSGASGDVGQDLLQRFANLRTSTANPVQDPRIRTQPISLPPSIPAPSHEASKPPLPNFPPLPSFTEMPRVPAAIYNPARGTVSSAAAELPSSSPRAIFTRTNSMTSSSSNPNRTMKPPVPGPSNIPQKHVFDQGKSTKRVKPSMPPGNTISVEDLLRYMQAGAKEVSILIIDIRSREEFDTGHIMSQATICIEADVLTRQHISAHGISESMVLAPTSEQLLFEKRHEFDLMVFYDQSSHRIPSQPSSLEGRAILGLYDALSQYDFSGASGSSAGPKLLEGGLDAWTSVVGTGSLQSSSTSGSGAKLPMAQALLRRRPTYAARSIQDPEEAKKWKDRIADTSAISPIRTTEDFLRRFPAISPIQESMQSPVSPLGSRPSSPISLRQSLEDTHYSSLPSPPTRPPPAVPRRSHSGLAEAENATNSLAPKKTALKQGFDHPRTRRTGLENPHNHCFANSVFQSLFATPGFARELWTGDWMSSYQVPRSPDERIENPQLLTRSLASLFHWLDQGSMKAISARTLMQYIYHIHAVDARGRRKPEGEIFGSATQQDANEFYYFLTDNIHDETNVFRNKRDTQKSASTEYTSKDGTIIQHAESFWKNYSLYNSSIIDKYFRGVEAFISTCQNPKCKRALYNFAVRNEHVLKFEDVPKKILKSKSDNPVLELEQLLQYSETNESVPTGLCEACNSRGLTRKYTIARMPDRLIFSIGRFTNEFNKVQTKVRFPITGLDMTRYMAQPDPEMNSTNDIHFAGRMIYDCYAVTVHQGTELRSGHYYSYVQDDQSRDPTDWFKCNDTHVERVKIGSPNAAGDMTERMFKDGTATAYQIFYKRRGTF